MTVETKLVLICLTLLAAAFVIGVLKVVGAWVEHHTSRHDLIVESKRKRIEYLRAVADRERELMALQEAEAEESIIIEDDEPQLAQAA
ncbi:MAG: hypothetical protein AAGB26_10665 [Planctomycetota bacterium]